MTRSWNASLGRCPRSLTIYGSINRVSFVSYFLHRDEVILYEEALECLSGVQIHPSPILALSAAYLNKTFTRRTPDEHSIVFNCLFFTLLGLNHLKRNKIHQILLEKKAFYKCCSEQCQLLLLICIQSITAINIYHVHLKWQQFKQLRKDI